MAVERDKDSDGRYLHYDAVVSGSCLTGRQNKISVAQKTERRMKQLRISKTKTAHHLISGPAQHHKQSHASRA